MNRHRLSGDHALVHGGVASHHHTVRGDLSSEGYTDQTDQIDPYCMICGTSLGAIISLTLLPRTTTTHRPSTGTCHRKVAQIEHIGQSPDRWGRLHPLIFLPRTTTPSDGRSVIQRLHKSDRSGRSNYEATWILNHCVEAAPGFIFTGKHGRVGKFFACIGKRSECLGAVSECPGKLSGCVGNFAK